MKKNPVTCQAMPFSLSLPLSTWVLVALCCGLMLAFGKAWHVSVRLIDERNAARNELDSTLRDRDALAARSASLSAALHERRGEIVLRAEALAAEKAAVSREAAQCAQIRLERQQWDDYSARFVPQMQELTRYCHHEFPDEMRIAESRNRPILAVVRDLLGELRSCRLEASR